MKYGDITLGHIEALINKLGGEEAVQAILRGEKSVEIKDALQKLFDKNGRRIPPRDLKTAVCDPNQSFFLKQPPLNLGDRLVRFQEAFHPGPCLSVVEFQGKADALVEKLKQQPRIVDLLNGVWLPTVLPRLEGRGFNYGEVLENVFLKAVEQAYAKEFPKRKFHNYRKGELTRQVNIIPESRHKKLLECMKREYVVALYFPDSLRGFSICASREQMASLPESLLLAGGFDTSTALVMWIDVLARDYYTPGLDLSALSWLSSDCSLDFKASGARLRFAHRAHLDHAYDNYSSGLLFLG